MRYNVRTVIVLTFLLVMELSCASTPSIPMSSGKVWLSNPTASPEVNVDGVWDSKDWGSMTFRQMQGSKDISGSTADGWRIDGVVSGKKIYLIFSDNIKINYSAILNADSDNMLTGVWARELITERSQTKSMKLSRK